MKKQKTKTQEQSFASKSWNDLKGSFRPDINCLKIILFDAIFYLISMPSLLLIGWLIKRKAESMSTIDLSPDLVTRPPQEIIAASSEIRSIFFFLIGGIILASLIILFSWSLSRALIYLNLEKKKLTAKNYFKFVGLNSILGLLLLITLLGFSTLVKVQSSTTLLIIIIVFYLMFAYFTSITYFYLAKTGEVFSSIGRALSTGVLKIGSLIIPCIAACIIFFVLSFLLANYIPLQMQARTYLLLAFFIVFLAWARRYFVPRLDEVPHKHR